MSTRSFLKIGLWLTLLSAPTTLAAQNQLSDQQQRQVFELAAVVTAYQFDQKCDFLTSFEYIAMFELANGYAAELRQQGIDPRQVVGGVRENVSRLNCRSIDQPALGGTLKDLKNFVGRSTANVFLPSPEHIDQWCSDLTDGIDSSAKRTIFLQALSAYRTRYGARTGPAVGNKDNGSPLCRVATNFKDVSYSRRNGGTLSSLLPGNFVPGSEGAVAWKFEKMAGIRGRTPNDLAWAVLEDRPWSEGGKVRSGYLQDGSLVLVFESASVATKRQFGKVEIAEELNVGVSDKARWSMQRRRDLERGPRQTVFTLRPEVALSLTRDLALGRSNYAVLIDLVGQSNQNGRRAPRISLETFALLRVYDYATVGKIPGFKPY